MSMSTLSPPLYFSSCPSPSYSSEPLSDEQTLEHNPRYRLRPSARASFTKKAGNTTVILNELEEAVAVGVEPPDIPLYSRNSVVTGEIHLDTSANRDVRAVVVNLESQVDLAITEGGSTSIQLFSHKYTLWQSDGDLDRPCPTILPLSCRFPSTYEDGTRTRPSPPSYRAAFHGPPGLFASCVYTLVVVVKKRRHRYLRFLTGRQKISIRLKRVPRTCPSRPILHDRSMLSTIKPFPEEWRQLVATMQTRSKSGVDPIECHLFIPSVQVYGVSDTIPFHVQLTGPLSSLLAFLPSYSDAISSSVNKPIIRVFLLRQILVEVRGEKGWRNCELGDGKLRALPPVAAGLTKAGDDQSLDWEGELRCKEDITVGGFNIGGKLMVKDFIVLATKPPRPETSPLLEFQYAHPIRLVTDSWSEAG